MRNYRDKRLASSMRQCSCQRSPPVLAWYQVGGSGRRKLGPKDLRNGILASQFFVVFRHPIQAAENVCALGDYKRNVNKFRMTNIGVQIRVK